MSRIKEASLAYCEKDDRLASLSYFGTYAVFFVALIGATLLWGSWLLMAPLIVIAAFAGVRLYVLQHDTGHFSLFSTRWGNIWAGIGLSVVTFTPFRAMQYNHNLHHANVGNLDNRETGEVYTMTVAEWEAAPWHTRLWYRLYRNPFIMIPIGGIFTFFVRYRWPKNAGHVGWQGLLAHNLLVIAFWGGMTLAFGMPGFLTLLATAILSTWIGVFLVYLQHNFEDTHWAHKPDLDFETAVIKGSSALDLGFWWDLGTGNIAYHDIHHLNPRIPSYRLRKCHRALREQGILPAEVIRWPDALRSFTLKVWDEEKQKLVPFPATRRQEATPAIPAE